MDSSQGILVEYKLDAFNMPRTGTTLCHPKIGYVDLTRNPALNTLALNSPLGHFNGDQHMPLHQTDKNHGDSKKNNPSHVRRHMPPSQPSQHLITQFRLNTHNLLRVLQYQKQTQYSMLQIKTLSLNTFRLSPSFFFFILFLFLTT